MARMRSDTDTDTVYQNRSLCEMLRHSFIEISLFHRPPVLSNRSLDVVTPSGWWSPLCSLVSVRDPCCCDSRPTIILHLPHSVRPFQLDFVRLFAPISHSCDISNTSVRPSVSQSDADHSSLHLPLCHGQSFSVRLSKCPGLRSE